MSPRAGADPGGGIDPRIRKRRDEIEQGRARRRARRTAGVLGAAALVAGGVALLHTPWFDAQVVTVTGAHPHTPASAIEAAAGLAHHPPLLSIDPGTAAARVESLPFIASAQVRRHWPDGVTIAVTERVPVATMAGPAGSWSELDGRGRTLAVGAARAPGLPVLIVHGPTGPVPPAPTGSTLAPAAGPGLAVARTLPAAFAAQVVSVTVAPDGTVDLALDSGLTVQIGTDTDLTAKYEDVAAIIAHAPLQGAHTIDVTVPQSPTVS